jgi:hypothetical protein
LRDVARKATDLLYPLKEETPLAAVQLLPKLWESSQVFSEACGGTVLGELRYLLQVSGREIEGFPDFPHGGSEAIRGEDCDETRMVVSVLFIDRQNELFSDVSGEV